MKRTAIVVAALVALAVTPAFAAKKAAGKKTATTCTSENMAKTAGAMNTMPDGPTKFALAKEMGAVNTEISKGNMRGACARYANAQKIAGGK